MAITIEVLDFPNLPIRSQLYYAGGSTYDGGFSTGGVRIGSPEPGGRSFLEIQLSLQVNEWNDPLVSWLMSKTNGDVFRVRLTNTPQVCPIVKSPWHNKGFAGFNLPWDNDQNWDNNEPWDDDYVLDVTNSPLAGTTGPIHVLNGTTSEGAPFGQVLKIGHVISFDGDTAYMVDKIQYNDAGTEFDIWVNPPLRRSLSADSAFLLLQPFFVGNITNGEEFRAAYEASNAGYIQPGRILLSEVIV